MYIKDFDSWNKKKKDINTKPRTNAHERDIWWVALGLNIGSEQDGKGDSYERPVIVIKKLSPNMYYVLPLSTKCKSSTMHIPFSHEKVEGYILLDQMKAVDIKRFIRKVGYVSQENFSEIITAFKKLL
jgi:mRNA interferase MazF